MLIETVQANYKIHYNYIRSSTCNRIVYLINATNFAFLTEKKVVVK